MTALHASLTVFIAIWIVSAIYVFSRIKKIYDKGEPYTNKLLTIWFMMWAFHHAPVILASVYGVWPLPLNKIVALAGGSLTVIAGVIILAVGMGAFGSYDRSVGKDTSELITGGIYRWSRNPQFIGWGLILLGISFAGRSGFALALTVLFMIVLHWYTVRLAEPYLERLHGETYLAYKQKAARWLGKPQKE